MSNPPADWYPDPAGSGNQRYWNGTAWTAHLRATPAPAPAAPTPPAWSSPGPAPQSQDQPSAPSAAPGATDPGQSGATTEGADSPYGNPVGSAYGDPAVDPYAVAGPAPYQPGPYGQPQAGQGLPGQGQAGQGGYAPAPYGQPYGTQPYGQQPYGQQGPEAGYPGYPQVPASPYGMEQAPGVPYSYGGPTTPDGMPLSGWWPRAGALILDGILLQVVVTIIGWRWMSNIWQAMRDFMSATMEAAANNGTPPTSLDLQAMIAGDALIVGIIGLVVSFAYHGVMLTRFGATLGKKALGLEVRLYEKPGHIGWGTFVIRWGLQFGLEAVGLIHAALSFIRYPFILLDYLFPLWDSRRQTIHDKAAKTVVVRVRD